MLYLRVNGMRREWWLDLPSLKSIQMGDYCFRETEELKLIGLNGLERVVIGKWCFYSVSYDADKDGMNPDRHFYLKNCEKLRELKAGCYSFRDYSVCEIENVPSLEVIEMGELNEYSGNFYYASLELKSDCERMKWWIDLPSLKSILFGQNAFARCSRVVFESDSIKRRWHIGLPRLTSIQLGFEALFFYHIGENRTLIMRSFSH